MLTLAMMGWVALGVLWVNAALISAAAWKQRGALEGVLERLRAAKTAGRLRLVEVVGGSGPEGVFAERAIEQMGRAVTTPGPDRILYTDRSARVAVFGGSVRESGREFSVVAAPEAGLWWTSREGVRDGGGSFDDAWPRASTFKGVVSTLVTRVETGPVWIELDTQERLVLVSDRDPVAEVVGGRRRLALLVFATLAGAAAVTALATRPPVFEGGWSLLGGVLGLAYFLGIQPIAVDVGDRAKVPSERLVGGERAR